MSALKIVLSVKLRQTVSSTGSISRRWSAILNATIRADPGTPWRVSGNASSDQSQAAPLSTDLSFSVPEIDTEDKKMTLKDNNTANNSVHKSVEVPKKLLPGLSAPRSCCWICERVLVNPYILPVTSAHNLHGHTQSFCKSAPIKQQTHLRLRWPEGDYVQLFFSFWGTIALFYWTLLTLVSSWPPSDSPSFTRKRA